MEREIYGRDRQGELNETAEHAAEPVAESAPQQRFSPPIPPSSNNEKSWASHGGDGSSDGSSAVTVGSGVAA